MDKMTRSLSYLIAAQVQAITLIIAGWLVGQWLNQKYPADFNWYAVTFPIAILAVAQSFYVIIRRVIELGKDREEKKSE